MPKTVACVVGARPNFVKIAPILRQFENSGSLTEILIHTGQHYDDNLAGQLLRDLDVRDPDINLDVGSGSHADQTARIMTGLDECLDDLRPDAMLVVGDVNSTLAGALVAAKKGIRVIHVEAGLRSFDRTMPEEINRVLTDRISDLLFVTEQAGVDNLESEGIAGAHVRLVGNVMIDSLFHAHACAIPADQTFANAGFDLRGTQGSSPAYALLTMHRPSNVDDPSILRPLLDVVREIADDMPVIFPIHPRTRAAAAHAKLAGSLEHPRLVVVDPVSYLGMVGLLADADLVLTDSGGLQEESSALGIPCLTLRENTERPVTVTMGTNIIVGNAADSLRAAFREFRAGDRKAGSSPPLWDGRTAERIVEQITNWI